MRRVLIAGCIIGFGIMGYGSAHLLGQTTSGSRSGDDSGRTVTPTPTPTPIPTPAPIASAQTSRLGTYTVLGWNDLGMHCLSPRFAEIAILPPYNDLMMVVIRRGSDTPRLVNTGVSLTYALDNNTTVVGKTDFWTYALPLFGKTLPLGIGLTGHGLSGSLVATGTDHFECTGIPLQPYNDDMTWNPYQRATVKLKVGTAPATAFTSSVVIPTSDELSCAKCHANGGVAATGITSTTVEQNVLKLHDLREKTNLMASRPVLCSACHSDNVLGVPGAAGVESLSGAMHAKHSSVATQPGCADCHPGAKTQCNRSAIPAMAPNSTTDPGCQKCHGDLKTVSDTIKAGRQPWFQEPTCAQCHGAAYQTKALYRKSTGHGGVPCSACHNSPHAWWPSMRADDNIQPVALQGGVSKAIGMKCSVCHTDGRTGTMPPHDRVGIIGGYTVPVDPGTGIVIPPGGGTTGGGTTGGGTGSSAGATLYTADCASCHGALASSSKLGRTAAQITAAISSVSQMRSLSTLGATNITAIASALGSSSGGTTGGGTTGGGTTGGGTTGGGTTGGGTTGTSTGATLYAADCASCHGALASSSKLGRTAAQITAAISSVSQMRSLSTLGAANITAIASALANPSGGTTGGGTTGGGTTGGGTTGGGTTGGGTTGTSTGPTLYAADCASCHGALASSSKRGRTAAQITAAISSVSQMRSLSTLAAADISAIATALGTTTTGGGTTGGGTTGGGTTGGGTTGTSTGATLYTANCASCHGALASSSVGGVSASQITSAIGSVSQMRGLSTLGATNITAIATALASSSGGGG